MAKEKIEGRNFIIFNYLETKCNIANLKLHGEAKFFCLTNFSMLFSKKNIGEKLCLLFCYAYDLSFQKKRSRDFMTVVHFLF